MSHDFLPSFQRWVIPAGADRDRRRFMSHELKRLFDSEPASPLYVAINRVLVKNDPDLMRMMNQASAKMCLATALTPGFRGFDLMRQVGTCPMGMRRVG
jgi:sulfur oxygenase/reductase